MRGNLFVILNSRALALLEEFAETQDDVIDIDNCILYRCRKKFFPILYPRMADMGYLISEIEVLDPRDQFMSVRFYCAFKK